MCFFTFRSCTQDPCVKSQKSDEEEGIEKLLDLSVLADTKDEKTLLLLLTYQKLLHEKNKNNNNNVKAILLKPQKSIFALRYLQDLYKQLICIYIYILLLFSKYYIYIGLEKKK